MFEYRRDILITFAWRHMCGVLVQSNSQVQITVIRYFPSVLWHCWLADRKDIWPVKVLVCYGDDLTGALHVLELKLSSPVLSSLSAINPVTQVQLDNGRLNGERMRSNCNRVTMLVRYHVFSLKCRKTEKLKDVTREHIVCVDKQIMCWWVLHHTLFANEDSGVHISKL